MKQLTLPGIETRKQYLVRMVRENAGRFAPSDENRAMREAVYLKLKYGEAFKTH